MNWVLSCPALENLHLENVLLLMPAPMEEAMENMGLLRVALVVTKVQRSWVTLSTELDPEQVMTMDPAWVRVMVMSRNVEAAQLMVTAGRVETLPVTAEL